MANNAKVMAAVSKMLHKMKALDEQLPEELAEDALEMTEEIKDALEEEELKTEDEEEEETKDACKDEESTITEEEVEKKVEDAFIKVMRKYGVIKDSAVESLDELEEELEKDADEIESEEKVTVDPEKINDSLYLLRRAKPGIASIKDARQRKIVADSFAKALKMNKKTTADYGAIFEASKSYAKDHAVNEDDMSLGEAWAKKYNPHYKEEN